MRIESPLNDEMIWISLSLCHVSHYTKLLCTMQIVINSLLLIQAHPYHECHTIAVLIQFHSRHPKHWDTYHVLLAFLRTADLTEKLQYALVFRSQNLPARQDYVNLFSQVSKCSFATFFSPLNRKLSSLLCWNPFSRVHSHVHASFLKIHVVIQRRNCTWCQSSSISISHPTFYFCVFESPSMFSSCPSLCDSL